MAVRLAGRLGGEPPLDLRRSFEAENACEGLGDFELPSGLDERVIDDLAQDHPLTVPEHDFRTAREHRVSNAERRRGQDLATRRALGVARLPTGAGESRVPARRRSRVRERRSSVLLRAPFDNGKRDDAREQGNASENE